MLLIDYLALKIAVLLCQSASTITTVYRALGNEHTTFDRAFFIYVCDHLPESKATGNSDWTERVLLHFVQKNYPWPSIPASGRFCIPFAAHVSKRFEPSQDPAESMMSARNTQRNKFRSAQISNTFYTCR